MLVSDLQNLLKGLSAFAASTNGKSSTIEMDMLVDGLQPFREKEIRAFLQLLVHAGGIDPLTIPSIAGSNRKSPPKSTKKQLKSNGDAQAIDQAVQQLRQLYDRATDPSLGYDEVGDTVKRIQDEFDLGGFKEVAKGFGISTGISSKKGCYEKITDKINDRKGSFERGQAIKNAAEPIPELQAVEESR